MSSAAGLPHAPSDPGLEENRLSVALMERVRDGDANAFQSLVEIHQSAVIGTVAKMLGSASDAEDIAQQVFVRVWKSACRYQPTAKFTTWLFTITRNLVFNEMRRKKRRQEISIDAHRDENHREIAEDSASRPDQATLQEELVVKIEEAIRALPEKQRLAVVLRRYEEMPYEEIGRVLNLSLPAVKSLLFRARSQLKELLAEYLGGED